MYEVKNIINWYKDKCYIFNFFSQKKKINAKRLSIPSTEMNYLDFYIRFEHKFLRNIYTKEELSTSTHLSTLETATKYLTNRTVTLLESVLNSHQTFDEVVSYELTELFMKKSTDCKKFED